MTIIKQQPMQSIVVNDDNNKENKRKKELLLQNIEIGLNKLQIIDMAVSYECLQILNQIIKQMSWSFIQKQRKQIVPVIILLACRKFSYPLTMRQAIKLANVKPKYFSRCLQKVKKGLPEYSQYSIKAINILNQIAKKVQIGNDLKKKATELLSNMQKTNTCSNEHQITLAACSIYMVLKANNYNNPDFNYTQFCKITDIAYSSLRKLYNKLEFYHPQLLQNLTINK